MPLSTGKSNQARQENVEKEIAAGKDPKQAVAIAYSQQRKNKEKASDSLKKMKDWVTKFEKKKK